MKWAIIILIMLSLIGSMLWVMPSPREKFQSKLRLNARQKGFSVSRALLQLPRAEGEIEAEKRELPLYRLLRHNLEKKERLNWTEWSVCRVRSQSNTGLPDGWSWIRGEERLDAAKLERLARWLECLGPEIIAVDSDAVHLSLYWTEPEHTDALDQLYETAQEAIAEKL